MVALNKPGGTRYPGAYFLGHTPRGPKKVIRTLKVQPEGKLPALWEFENLLLMPDKFALYHEDGTRVPGSEYKYVDPTLPVAPFHADAYHRASDNAAPPRITPPSRDDVEIIDRPMLYLGAFFAHYGHFLTDCCARMWAHLCTPADYHRVFRPAKPAATFVQPFLDALDIQPFKATRPLLFKRTLIPEPALQTCYQIYRNADVAFLDVAAKIERPQPRCYDRVYLSRRLVSTGARHSPNEAEIEGLFEKRGFEIVHPENLSLAAQIHIFNTASMIAGITGSSFHTALFCSPDYKGSMIVITPELVANGRYLLTGALKQFETYYIRGYEHCVLPDRQIDMTLDVGRIESHLCTLGL